MKKAYYPRPTMCITQGYNGSLSHQGTYAIDDCGEDDGIDWFLAPFDCVVKKVLNESFGIWIWAESIDEVECVNGYVGHLTIMVGHDNKVRHEVGDIVKEGEYLAAEGTSGNATGNHNHFELGLGKYENTWYDNGHKNKWGKPVYMLYNAIKPHEYLFLKEGYTIKKGGGYSWTYEKTVETPEYDEEYVKGIVDSVGVLTTENEALNTKLEQAEKEIVVKDDKIALLDKKINILTEKMAEMTSQMFTASKDGTYYIELQEGDILYKE